MKKVLFLDDSLSRTEVFLERVPYAETFLTADEIITRLKDEDYFDMVFLDHDLGGEIYASSDRADTGMEVVRFIEKNKPEIAEVIVHSMNHPAGREMTTRLRVAGYKVSYLPFSILLKNINN